METAPLHQSLLASVLAGGVATTLGAVPVMVRSHLSRATENTLMGFGAGVMLAAAAFSLLAPGLEHARGLFAGGLSPVLLVGGGFAAGGILVSSVHRLFPHEHFFKGTENMPEPSGSKVSRTWLFVGAIAFHNFPEGLSVGVAVASGEASTSLPLTLGIAAQNMPEGMVVAVAMVAAGYSRLRALAVTAFTGFVEPFGALVGHLGVGLATVALPFGFGLAAGAMVFVVSDEIIPESHQVAAGRATLGLMTGFLMMLAFDALIV